jgi:hypothetical protein
VARQSRRPCPQPAAAGRCDADARVPAGALERRRGDHWPGGRLRRRRAGRGPVACAAVHRDSVLRMGEPWTR